MRVIDERFFHRLVGPATVHAMPQPECFLPCRRHKEAVDVDTEAAEHGTDVKMLDLRERVGHAISNGTLNGPHVVIVQPSTSQGAPSLNRILAFAVIVGKPD
jgi:hypothetical protein